MQESPDSVHAAVDIAHAYLHHAVEQICQSPPQVVSKPENMQNTKAAHAHQSNANQIAKCNAMKLGSRASTTQAAELLSAAATDAAALVPLRPTGDDSDTRPSTLLARNGYGVGGPSAVLVVANPYRGAGCELPEVHVEAQA